MDTKELKADIAKNFNEFIEFINTLNKEQFELSVNDKWSAGQQLLHQYLALKPLAQALGVYPKMALKMMGKSKVPVRTCNELVAFYEKTLTEQEVPANSGFSPSTVSFDKKEGLIEKINKQQSLLINGIDKFSEEELNTMLLPHPLLGKIPIKEMLYFSKHHVAHHTIKMKENL